MASQRVQASVLHGERDLRIVSFPIIYSPLSHTHKRITGRPRPPPSRKRRDPNRGKIHRPLWLRPALLQPLPQRRHSRPRTAHPRPRVQRHSRRRRLRRQGLCRWRQCCSRGRNTLRGVRLLLQRTVQHLSRHEVSELGQGVSARAGDVAGVC